MFRPIVLSGILILIFNGFPQPTNAQNAEVDWDWWKTAVVYQIYPKSFKDQNNDGYGDLRGIIDKLPHLADAGVTMAWISPIYSSPQVDDGYDISNYTDVWETFGTLDDFEEMVEVAHNLGIRIVMDLVPNHSSDEHEWFKLSENRTSGYEDYYVWLDGVNSTSPPNNWISVFKYSAWTYSETRGQWYLHQFTEAQPDLNFRNPVVLEEMTNVILFWLDRGVDGFRVDAIPHLVEDENFLDEPLSGYEGVEWYEYDYLNHIYSKDLNETYDIIYYWREILDNYTIEHGGDARIMMVESSSGIEKTMMYYTNGIKDGSHFPFNFQIIYSISETSTAADIVNVVNYWMDNMPEGDYVPNWGIGNHDQKRAASRFGTNNVDAFNMLNLLLPGVAVTYNGEEIGMENGEVTWEQGQDPSACNGEESNFNSTTRDFARTPYHWDNTTNAGFNNGTETWLPVSEKYKETNLLFQSDTTSNSHYQVYKKLANLRKGTAFAKGGFEIAAVDTYVTAFTRIFNETEGFVVLINTYTTTITVDLTTYFSDIGTELEIAVKSSISTKNEGDIVQANSVSLASYESLVLSLKSISQTDESDADDSTDTETDDNDDTETDENSGAFFNSPLNMFIISILVLISLYN